jgi:hypothetical protein
MASRLYIGRSGSVYEPIASIGPGGFGSVQLVRNETGNEFALKTLHLGFDPGVLEAEAGNLRRVNDPNVVAYVDDGADPEPFLVMELADGGSLKDYIASAQQAGDHFPVEMLLDWAGQLLSGLKAVHAELLHRDLKPGNVLLAGERLKIADFGMTRLVEASTRTETLKGGGTPLYMPPEGWAGPTGPRPTAAYDLYSLGVILYELATLQTPFTGDRDELRHQHLFVEAQSPRALRPDLPSSIERLILQLLRKTPDERGISASDVLGHLELPEARPNDEVSATSAVLARLQEGASSLMVEAVQREAQAARALEEQRRRLELVTAGITKFDSMMEAAIGVVVANIAPLKVTGGGREGRWLIRIEHSPRHLAVNLEGVSKETFQAGNAPGEIIMFGSLQVYENISGSSAKVIGGANLVAFVNPDAPWVIHLQEIQLRNQALMTTPMRVFEPFFLEQNEVGEHGRWLWGGAMHVFSASHRELTTDVLVEWFAQLLPTG